MIVKFSFLSCYSIIVQPRKNEYKSSKFQMRLREKPAKSVCHGTLELSRNKKKKFFFYVPTKKTIYFWRACSLDAAPIKTDLSTLQGRSGTKPFSESEVYLKLTKQTDKTREKARGSNWAPWYHQIFALPYPKSFHIKYNLSHLFFPCQWSSFPEAIVLISSEPLFIITTTWLCIIISPRV